MKKSKWATIGLPILLVSSSWLLVVMFFKWLLFPSPEGLFAQAVIQNVPKSVNILNSSADGQIFPTDLIFLHFTVDKTGLAQIIDKRKLVPNIAPMTCSPYPKWWRPQGPSYQNIVGNRGYYAREFLSMWIKDSAETNRVEVWYTRFQE